MSDMLARNKVTAALGFSEAMDVRMKYHANDSSMDVMNVIPAIAPIENLRDAMQKPNLDLEGFALVPHKSAVRDFRDAAEVERVYADEIRQLVRQNTGADQVEINGRGILRYGEKSQDSGAHDNSRPARFVHIDISDATAAQFRTRLPLQPGRTVGRVVNYNIWRVLTPPPQDVPLAVCDARTVSAKDLIPADAMFDIDGQIAFQFEGLVLRRNPAQRWCYFADMTPDEALIFKTNDSDPDKASQVPHGAFDNPLCPPGTEPRASIEMRATAIWYD